MIEKHIEHKAEPAITPDLVASHGLTADEYERILAILGRVPTFTELGIFSVMWSEHCSYKSSRRHLAKFPTTAPWVLQGPGENAGVIDAGNGMAVCFKIESHNHPSYIEPYEGAATGVGGIMRDVFTMGARPIANLNALHFGEPSHPKTAYLLENVVRGIGHYGNCMGVPTIGGECIFNRSYNGNCLVNAFTLGIMPADKIFRGRAEGVGNAVFYVGNKTGRDGIHGATMASDTFSEDNEAKRPNVQVGDPFTEKRLLEACLELMQSDAIIGIQDMGAAGLTSSSCEMAGRAGTGVEIDIDLVPRREPGMTPYEVMLSESQERMLMVIRHEKLEHAKAIFAKWDLDAAVIGKVTGDGMLRVVANGRTYAEIPAQTISEEAPKYDRPAREPAHYRERLQLDVASVPVPEDLGATLTWMLGTPTLCSKRWIWGQYDHSVRVSTVVEPGHDAGILRMPGSEMGIGMTVDCNPLYCELDPYEGGRLAVAEAARNLSVCGITPKAVTDNLNFGDPRKPEVMWSFIRAVEGIADACKAFNTPVVGGNVSLYNESEDSAVFPTPTVAMVGLCADVRAVVKSHFTDADALIVLLGENTDELGGSAYLYEVHKTLRGAPPRLDYAVERKVQGFIRKWVEAGAILSAHDVSDGGLAVALAEMGLNAPGGPMGCDVGLVSELRDDVLLFGEGQSRVLLTIPPIVQRRLEEEAEKAGVPFRVLGKTGGDEFRFEPYLRVKMSVLAASYFGGLEKVLAKA